MTLPDALARLEGVRPCASGYTAKCPAHRDRNASLSLREGKNGKPLFKCFAGCDYRAILDALGDQPRGRILSPLSTPPTLDEAHRTEYSLRIWREARLAVGTLVEVYLRARGITSPIPPSIRFHPSLKHPSAGYLPAMVAGVQAMDGQIMAIHRTYLRPDGTGKANVDRQKMMLGPCAGGAVRFAKPTSTVAVAEGIETSLSVAQACPRLAVWAALSTSGMVALQLPDAVCEVIICADADPAGRKAAMNLAMRLGREGRIVRTAYPPVGNDFNDILSQGLSA
jgi:putative DNA primase/helicase